MKKNLFCMCDYEAACLGGLRIGIEVFLVSAPRLFGLYFCYILFLMLASADEFLKHFFLYFYKRSLFIHSSFPSWDLKYLTHSNGHYIS